MMSMHLRRTMPTLVALFASAALAGSASAGHHRWDFTEIFSNASGTVQYIELFSANDGEAGLGPFSITAGANTFNFVTNLSGSTANTWVLVATTGFAALSGAPTPDYTLADSFFSTAGGTLNYASGADVWAYGAVPTNGTSALARDGSTPTNSPTNFAGASGSVNAGPPAAPGLFGWGLVFLVGALLLVASGVLRRSPVPA